MAFGAKAQTDSAANAILGNFQNENGSRKMEIYQSNNQFFGKITATDNADKIKVGTVMLKNLQYSKGQWAGVAYVPRFNKDIDATVTMPNNDTLEISAMGRTKVWTRIKK